MSTSLETAAHPENLRRVVIDPVSREEGHGKVTILLDDKNKVHQVRLHIVEFRGFEKFIQGRPYWEVPVMVQRLCGICPVSHHLAAAKAMDVIVGAGTGGGLTWLELRPRTGRTHQIRVHCAMLGTPILGDERYGTGGGGSVSTGS